MIYRHIVGIICLGSALCLSGCKIHDSSYKYIEISPGNIEKSSIMPDEEEVDYFNHGGHYSPYPLIRFARPVEFEGKTIKPGFYLLKLYQEAGVTYLLFKKETKLAAAIPIDNIESIVEEYKDPEVSAAYNQDNTTCTLELKYLFQKYTVHFQVK